MAKDEFPLITLRRYLRNEAPKPISQAYRGLEKRGLQQVAGLLDKTERAIKPKRR